MSKLIWKKITKKYKNLPAPVKASFWFLICGFLQKGVAMLTTPIFTRVMIDSEYGRFNIFNSWESIISILISLNLAAGVYTRGLVKYEEDQDEFSSTMLGLSTTSILIGASIYFLFHKKINGIIGISTGLMTCMILQIWLTSIFLFWSNRERVNYQYKKLVIITSMYVILSPLLGVVLVLIVPDRFQVEARVLSLLIMSIILYSGLFISMIKKGNKFINFKYWKYALLFNLPLVPHYLSQIILNTSDRLMISSFCGNAEAGFYSVAYSISMVMLIFNNAVSSTMNPWIYKSIKAEKYEEIGKFSYIILSAIALINFFMVAFGPELIKIMAPPSYHLAKWVIPPLTASVYFTFLYNLFATFEYYYAKTNFVMIASMICAGLNIILNYITINKYGFIAAGYTTLICYILYSIAHYIFMRKVCKIYMKNKKIYNIKIIIAIGVALILGCGIMMCLYEMPIARYTLLIICGCIVWFKRSIFIKTIKKIKS